MKRICFLAVVLGSSLSWGATYYVDFSNGLNTNTGKSQTSAWKNCPGDSAATDVSAQTSFAPGDSVIFRGGVDYKGQTKVK